MSVRRKIPEKGIIYFITFTCAMWQHLFEQALCYDGNFIKRFGINRSSEDKIKLEPKQLNPSVYPSGSSYPK
jgi:hypothetical protein